MPIIDNHKNHGEYCLNCQTHVPGKYCVVCGEDENDTFDFKHLIRDLLDLWGWKQGFFFTLYSLLFHPLRLIREYLEGKTRPYTAPIKMNILVVTLSYFFAYYYQPEVIFDDFYSFLFSLVLLINWLIVNLIFFFWVRWSLRKHIIILLYLSALIGSIDLLASICIYFIGISLLKIESIVVDSLGPIPILIGFFYSIYIIFSLITAKKILKALLIVPYCIIGLICGLFIGISFLELYPERNFGKPPSERKGKYLVYMNECYVDVEVSIAYQSYDGKWNHIEGINVKAQEEVILQKNGDTLRISNPSVFLYAFNAESGFKWAEDKPVIFNREEFLTYQQELVAHNGNYYHSISCLNALRKHERMLIKEFNGKYFAGFEMNNPDSTSNWEGVKIAYIFQDLPAQKSGLLVGDIIINVDSTKIINYDSYNSIINQRKSDTVNLTILRNNKKYYKTMILEKFILDSLDVR